MQRKTKQAFALIAIVALFMQTVIGSLPAIAKGNPSPLHITMTTDGQLYNEGEIATSTVEVTVTTTSGDSAKIEISQDARTTWQPFNHTEPLVITEEGEHELWFRLADVEERRIIKIGSQLVQPLQLMPATTQDSATIYVDAKKSSGGDGKSWTTAYNDLQQALDDAKAKLQVNPTTKLEIWLAAGTYKPTKEADGTGARYRTFQMQNNVAIYGGFNGTETELTARNWEQYPTILSGDIGIENNKSDNAVHVFYHPAGLNLNETAILDGVTIKEGNSRGFHPDGYGGGMYNNGSSPTLTNVTFSSNTAVHGGGGMYNEGSSPTLTNVVFSSNTGGGGGGLYNKSSSSPTLMNVIFQSNEASHGGGMWNNSSSPTLTNVTFSSNTAANNGGGMSNGDSSPTLTNVTFSSNTATNDGGGMVNENNSSPLLTNVTFERNTAATGGGMYNDSSPTLTNVTMSGNESTSSTKGAIYGGMPNIRNSIIADNNGEPALHASVAATIENSLLDVEEAGQILAMFHQSTTDRQPDTYPPEAIFIDPSQYDYRLRAGSPAINKGNNTRNTELNDLLGNPRKQDTFIDLGAYEAFPYHITYERNDATSGNAPIDKLTYQQGDTVTIQNNSGILERTGHTFVGWNTQADGTGDDYAENTSFTMGAQNQTFYAKWIPNNYKVIFESNGGSDVAEQQVLYNEKAIAPPVPSKQGHTFAGWYTDGNEEWDFAMDVVTKDITLYAQWTANPTYTVTYDSNGATGGDIPEDTQRYEENTSVTVQGNSGNLTRTGYTFVGWNTQADGKGKSYTEKATFQMGTANITLYAQWTANPNPPSTNGGSNVSNDNNDAPPAKVTITLRTNGGTAIAPIDIAYNTKISDLPVPTREGYRFVGWYQDEELTKPWAADTVLRENISLYAKWTALPVEEPQPESPSPTVTFSDIQRHWAKEMIEELASAGIIQGYEDGTFRPNESISRMHVAVLVGRAFTFEPRREAKNFTDVSSSHPYYEAIMALQQAGIIDGANGAFFPAENMTRAQLAKVLVGIMGRAPEGISSFVDVDQKHWSTSYIAVLEQEGIALGDNGNFHPNEPVTRAQFIAFLYRMLHRAPSL